MDTAARIAPRSRRRLVSLRVSMPSIATIPPAASSASSVRSERQLLARREASRTAKPATCTRADSGSAWFMP